jgi:hypothetical protein
MFGQPINLRAVAATAVLLSAATINASMADPDERTITIVSRSQRVVTLESTDHFNRKNDTSIKIKAGETKLLPIHVANSTTSFLLTSHCKLDERRTDNSGMTGTYNKVPKLVEVIDDKLTNADLCRLKATY